MKKAELKNMSVTEFIQAYMYPIAQAYANGDTSVDVLSSLQNQYEEANGVYGVIDWEDLYDDNGERMGVRIEDEIFTDDWYRREHAEA